MAILDHAVERQELGMFVTIDTAESKPCIYSDFSCPRQKKNFCFQTTMELHSAESVIRDAPLNAVR